MYSKRAMLQLATIASGSDKVRNRRWPYHATVMKVFESSNRPTAFHASLMRRLCTIAGTIGQAGGRRAGAVPINTRWRAPPPRRLLATTGAGAAARERGPPRDWTGRVL